jgi:hypothetical protein
MSVKQRQCTCTIIISTRASQFIRQFFSCYELEDHLQKIYADFWLDSLRTIIGLRIDCCETLPYDKVCGVVYGMRGRLFIPPSLNCSIFAFCPDIKISKKEPRKIKY